MKKHILAAAAALLLASAPTFAAAPAEVMVITLTNGTTVQYPVADIVRVDFQEMALSNSYTFFDKDGKPLIDTDITGATLASNQFSTLANTVKFTTEAYVADGVQIQFADEVINKGECSFADVTGFYLRTNNLQLYSKADNEYKNSADNGTFSVSFDEATGEYEFSVDVVNYYNNYSGTHKGTPERVVLHYKGTVSK